MPSATLQKDKVLTKTNNDLPVCEPRANTPRPHNPSLGMSGVKAPHKGMPPTCTAKFARYLLKKKLENTEDMNKQGGTRKLCYPSAGAGVY